MRFLRAIFLLLGAIHLLIGPMNFMQLIAWGKMIGDYSQGRSLQEAAAMTLSGEYPCDMCRAIAEAKKQEQEHPQAPASSEERSGLRLDLVDLDVVTVQATRWVLESNQAYAGLANEEASSQMMEPMTPPPWWSQIA